MSVVSVRGKCVPKAQKGTSLPRDTHLTPYTPQHVVPPARTEGVLIFSLRKIYQSQTGLSIQSSNDVTKVKWTAEPQWAVVSTQGCKKVRGMGCEVARKAGFGV